MLCWLICGCVLWGGGIGARTKSSDVKNAVIVTIRGPKICCTYSTELEFLKSLWGLGTEEEQGFRTGPQATLAGGIHSLESIPGPQKHLKVRALYLRNCLRVKV